MQVLANQQFLKKLIGSKLHLIYKIVETIKSSFSWTTENE